MPWRYSYVSHTRYGQVWRWRLPANWGNLGKPWKTSENPQKVTAAIFEIGEFFFLGDFQLLWKPVVSEWGCPVIGHQITRDRIIFQYTLFHPLYIGYTLNWERFGQRVFGLAYNRWPKKENALTFEIQDIINSQVSTYSKHWNVLLAARVSCSQGKFDYKVRKGWFSEMSPIVFIRWSLTTLILESVLVFGEFLIGFTSVKIPVYNECNNCISLQSLSTQ